MGSAKLGRLGESACELSQWYQEVSTGEPVGHCLGVPRCLLCLMESEQVLWGQW